MKIIKRLFITLLAMLAGLGILAAIEFFGGQPMGLFSGSRPTQLGFNAGKFVPPSWKPNSVSSTVEKTDPHFIQPFAVSGDAAQTWQKIVGLVKATPRASVITERENYLHAEFKSAGMGFVDDVELALDGDTKVIHVRSASRLGIRDFNVNRDRVEALRRDLNR